MSKKIGAVSREMIDAAIKPHCAHGVAAKGPKCTPACGWPTKRKLINDDAQLIRELTAPRTYTPGPLEVVQNDSRLCVRGTEDLFSVARRPASCVIEIVAENLTKPDATLYAAAPEIVAALKHAAEIIKTARRYFPKSIRNRDTFSLELCNAGIGKALYKAGVR